MNATTWITLGILAGAFSLFAIPYGFSLITGKEVSQTVTVNADNEIVPSDVNGAQGGILTRIESSSAVENMTNSVGGSEATIKKQHQIAKKIPGTITRGSALEKLALKSADLGYYNTAFEIALDIPGSITQSSALSYIAIKTAKSGNLELAGIIADKIPGSITKGDTLEKISNM